MPINPPAEETKVEIAVSKVQEIAYFNRRPLAMLLAVVAAGAAGAISPLAVAPVLLGVLAGLALR